MLPSTESLDTGPEAQPNRDIPLAAIFLAFAKIGLTAFGGGLSGWMMRDFVRERRWVDESDFLNGLALSQSFPGTNVVNLAIWIGNRLRGGLGSSAAVAGLLGPSLLAAVAFLAVFDLFAGFRASHQILAGVGAAAIGLSMQMAITAARRAAKSAFSVAVIAAVFAAICLFHLPLPLVVAVAAPISIGVAYLKRREG